MLWPFACKEVPRQRGDYRPTVQHRACRACMSGASVIGEGSMCSQWPWSPVTTIYTRAAWRTYAVRPFPGGLTDERFGARAFPGPSRHGPQGVHGGRRAGGDAAEEPVARPYPGAPRDRAGRVTGRGGGVLRVRTPSLWVALDAYIEEEGRRPKPVGVATEHTDYMDLGLVGGDGAAEAVSRRRR